jgi:hypothetical protein
MQLFGLNLLYKRFWVFTGRRCLVRDQSFVGRTSNPEKLVADQTTTPDKKTQKLLYNT